LLLPFSICSAMFSRKKPASNPKSCLLILSDSVWNTSRRLSLASSRLEPLWSYLISITDPPSTSVAVDASSQRWLPFNSYSIVSAWFLFSSLRCSSASWIASLPSSDKIITNHEITHYFWGNPSVNYEWYSLNILIIICKWLVSEIVHCRVFNYPTQK
jgi:hypothetical protein